MALILGAHAGLLLFLTHNGLWVPVDVSAIRMDVRTIDAPAAPLAPIPVPPASPPKPKIQPAKTVSPPAAPTPLPVLVATTAEGSSTLSVAPQPSAPAVAPGLAAAPAVAAAPPPAPVVTPARFDADYLKNPAPQYPLTSRMMKEHGTVLLWVNVTAQGDAERVRVHQSSGKPRLDEAALDAVGQWRFVPARRGDQAIAASVIVPIVFELDR